jgi:hypothetical protein
VVRSVSAPTATGSSVDAEEAAQFSGFADALLINVGTLTAERQQAMQAAVVSAPTATGSSVQGVPACLAAVTAACIACWRSAVSAAEPAASGDPR